MNTENLSKLIKRALQENDPDKANRLLTQALAEIKKVWNNLQPQYNQDVREINAWQKVAIQALKQNREDLARAAIVRKKQYEKRAQENKEKLDKLAQMTEILIRSRLNMK